MIVNLEWAAAGVHATSENGPSHGLSTGYSEGLTLINISPNDSINTIEIQKVLGLQSEILFRLNRYEVNAIEVVVDHPVPH
jgi:hypothetical protein